MIASHRLITRFVCSLALAAAAFAQTDPRLTVQGTVTDPSGALVPAASVSLRGPGGNQSTKTDATGKYSFTVPRDGNYTLRVGMKGFATMQKQLNVAAPVSADIQLVIAAEAQVVNVEDDNNTVSTDSSSNGTAIVLRQKELEALSDDPDELQQQLQAMAGPGAGPNGGQIYIDGFTGGNMPSKSSIREIRINSNPFSAEYDRPGFGRIEILTRPGTDSIRGQAFFQFNNQHFNTRSPLLSRPDLPEYQNRFFGFHLTGPIKKQKASFGLDVERRDITENAFILATTLDSAFNTQSVNQAILTPQVRTQISPRFDYAINTNNTLVLRYQNVDVREDNEGIGDFSLASRGYKQTLAERVLQVTYTSILKPTMVNESRFQFMRMNSQRSGDNSTPAINVQGAFSGGGAQVGNSGSLNNRWEYTNLSTLTKGRHIIKWGGRLKQVFLDDTSVMNFGGSYTFFGGQGPALDANNNAIAGTSVDLTALERYRRTLLFQQLGFSGAQIRALGGGASQFSLSAGTPLASLNQFDIGLFVTDDFRFRPNLTLSYGLRYETQTNISDFTNWAPRIGLAWAIDQKGTTAGKTVFRAGFGAFYDRVGESESLQALRYNGTTQLSYLIQNPDFFPVIPSLETLAAGKQPQQLQPLDSSAVAPRTYQWSFGLDRQITKSFRLSGQYIMGRGVHLRRNVNINAPINGVYPFGDRQMRLLTETVGFSRNSMIAISPNISWKKLILFGHYSYGHGRSDAEGLPANPYDLRAEYGPSGFQDVRHRIFMGTNLTLKYGVSISPFMMASTGSPYNITTGRDINLDGTTAERPALLNLAAANCTGGSLVYKTGFGCYDVNPGLGVATIGRNTARGPGQVNLSMRIAKSWAFGNRGESGPTEGGPPPGMGGSRGGPDGGRGPGGGGGGPRGGGPPMGGGMRGGPGGGGPPPGMFGSASGKKYNLSISASARNLLNHANYAAPSGDLSSPFFGQYRSLAGFGPFGGTSTYQRKIDLQLRFTF
ncbi:MAG: TonB-dependent receptor [Acidobacteria bacterium]|nr:TonB-dependent receptor [Acidobacteriota bacterium]